MSTKESAGGRYGVVLFHTTSAALRGEKVLKAAGLAIKLIPVPRELSSSCGISLRFEWQDGQSVRETLDSARADYAEIHHLAK